MFNFSNIVYIERRKYTYSLDEDNNKLILIPHSKEINEFSIVKELMGKWIYLKGDELANFSALLGYGHVHRGNMCFDITCLVRYFPDFNKKVQKPGTFKSISFSSLAIDYFIGHKNGLLDKSINILSKFKNDENNDDEIEEPKKHKFIYKGNEYNLYFMTIGRFEFEKRFPFNIFSTLNIESSKNINLDELYDLVNLIRLFLQFISNRRVIDIDEIFIMKENESFDFNGTVKLNNFKLMEPSKWNIITYDLIKDNLSNLLQEIADNNICFRSLFNYESDKINSVDIMNICASFESQFNNTYPNFKNKDFKKVKKEIIEYLKIMPNNYNTSELEEMNNIINGIKNYNDTLKSKLQYALEEFIKIYESGGGKVNFDFGKDYINMPNRFKNARNALDHGNVKYELSNQEYFDVNLVRAIIYMMILKKIKLSDEQIKMCIRKIIKGIE
jgi:hypothetical protein